MTTTLNITAFVQALESTLKNSMQQKYLLAVSGGIDSMTMAHLFVTCGYGCIIAHCNFCLRGDESDGDEELVRDYAFKHNIPFFTTRFDTAGYASTNGISTQIAARELRYKWFEQIRQREGCNKIAVAHNADDNLETFFINLTRGAGLNGLTGIPANTATIVRPLLRFSRRNIEQYASVNSVVFREDSSNPTDKYLRNKLRHKILPVLDEISPSFRKKAAESIAYLKAANEYIDAEAAAFLHGNSVSYDGMLRILLQSIKMSHSPEILLFHILEPYGFKGEAIAKIHNCVVNPVTGKQFFSATHRIVIDRESLVISCMSDMYKEVYLAENSSVMTGNISLHCETVVRDESFILTRDSMTGEFDLSLLQFPLLLRPCKSGDRFVPLGMKGEKKLSDFMTNLKLSRHEKDRQTVLLSGNDIIWVAGRRIDDRYKVNEQTKKVLRVQFRTVN